MDAPMTDTSGREDAVRRDALGVVSPGIEGTELPRWVSRLLSEGLAGLWLFGHNVVDPAQCRALCDEVHAISPGALVCSDEEGGTVTRLHHAGGAPWPGAWALGRTDEETTREVMRGLGGELATAGIDLTAAPVADVNTEPSNPIIGIRSFGADPGLVARHVVASIEGLREAGVLSCAKHFPGHGDTHQDSHLTLPALTVDPDLLATRELVPFRAAVEAGVDVVMTAHLQVPGYGELPATLNPSVLALLRDDLGFEGVVCTDAVDMAGVAATYGRERAAVLALVAGVDLVCVGNPRFPDEYDAEADTGAIVDAIVAAVRDGELSRERLAEAAQRVRALGRRHADRRAAPQWRPLSDVIGARGEDHPGTAAARRALDVRGGAPGQVHGARVVGLSTAGNIASGARQEVVLRVLAEALGGEFETLEPGGDGTGPGGTGAAPRDGRPVVVVCDDHTDLDDPAVRAAVANADAVVHTGIRELPDGVAPAWLVRTYGGGAASATAAAEVLAGASVPAARERTVPNLEG